jgi:predicted nucleotidyltransferase
MHMRVPLDVRHPVPAHVRHAAALYLQMNEALAADKKLAHCRAVLQGSYASATALPDSSVDITILDTAAALQRAPSLQPGAPLAEADAKEHEKRLKKVQPPPHRSMLPHARARFQVRVRVRVRFRFSCRFRFGFRLRFRFRFRAATHARGGA